MKIPVFKGLCTALISPFTANGIDYRRMGELIDIQEKGGADAILVAGTTGEVPTLEIHEYDALVDLSVKYADGKMKVIAGIGGNNTEQCLHKALRVEEAGADAVLMTAPYYNKTSPSGLIKHFTYVADRVGIPLIIYNVPGRTAMNITIETYKELSKHPNINGVKEASGDVSLALRTIAECGDNLYVWSGNDTDSVPMMSVGALGVISVASNIIPEPLSLMCELCLGGNYAAASVLAAKYSDFFNKLFIETNPIPIKAAMKYASLDSGKVRLPLTEISDKAGSMLRESMEKIGIAVS